MALDNPFLDPKKNPFMDPRNNPFLDPKNNPFLSQDMMKALGEFKIPGLDIEGVMAAHRRNFEARFEATVVVPHVQETREKRRGPISVIIAAAAAAA